MRMDLEHQRPIRAMRWGWAPAQRRAVVPPERRLREEMELDSMPVLGCTRAAVRRRMWVTMVVVTGMALFRAV